MQKNKFTGKSKTKDFLIKNEQRYIKISGSLITKKVFKLLRPGDMRLYPEQNTKKIIEINQNEIKRHHTKKSKSQKLQNNFYPEFKLIIPK